MSYDIDPVTADCYEGTTCLINRFDIHDEKLLEKIDADITFAKSAEFEQRPLKGEFNTEYYKAIHKYLFGELYDWAGEYRKKEHSLLVLKSWKSCRTEYFSD